MSRKLSAPFLPVMREEIKVNNALMNAYLSERALKNAATQNRKKTPPAPARRRRRALTANMPLSRGMPAGTMVRTAPAARSFYARGSPPKVVQTNGGLTVTGVDFLGGVNGFTASNPILAGVANLHPAYFLNDALGNFSRSYRQFKVDKARVCFATTSPTSVAGYVLLTSNTDGLAPALPADDSSFLNRAISSAQTVMGPVWEDLCTDIPLPKTWQDVDAFESSDWRDHIPSEVFCYTTAATGNIGNLILEYTVSFRDLQFTAHNLLLPYSNYQQVKSTDAGTTAANSAVVLSSTILNAPGSGTVWKCILDTDQTVLGGGTTLANAWKIGNEAAGSNDTTITLTSGMVFYLVVAGSVQYVFPDLDSAISQSANKNIYVQTTQTGVTTYAFQAIQVHYSAYATVRTAQS